MIGLTVEHLVVLSGELHLAIDCLRKSDKRARTLRDIAELVDAAVKQEASDDVYP